MRQLVRYTCEGEVWTAFTTGDGDPGQVIEHHHHGDPHTIHSVTEVPEGMLVYTVISQFENSHCHTDVVFAKNVEDAARQTYQHWEENLFLGSEVTSADVTIYKIEMGENPCAHLARIREVAEEVPLKKFTCYYIRPDNYYCHEEVMAENAMAITFHEGWKLLRVQGEQ